MDKENRTIIVLGVAIVIGVILGVFLAQIVLWEIKTTSKDVRDMSSNMNELIVSIKGIDSSLQEVKTSLTEKETVEFRRNMEENGRRMLVMNYAGRLTKWDSVKKEIADVDKNLDNAANMRPDLASSLQNFRKTYIPKLNDMADKKDIKNFEVAWSNTYDACVVCHTGTTAPPEAFETLREISSEVEELSG